MLRLTLLGAVTLALGLGLCSCGLDPADKAAARDVVIIGDSITARSSDEIQQKLPDATIIAMEGQMATFMAPRPADPDIVVLALGTNDVWKGVPAEDIADALDLIAMQAECVAVMTLPASTEGRATSFGLVYDDAAAVEASERLTQLADVVVDWAGATAADPGLIEDGVHPTPEGQRRLAELMADAVDECAGKVESAQK